MTFRNIISGKRGRVVGRKDSRYIVLSEGAREYVDALDFVATWKPEENKTKGGTQ